MCIPVFPLLHLRVAAGFLCTKRRFVHCVHTLHLALVCKAHLQFFLANKLWIIIVDTKPRFSQLPAYMYSWVYERENVLPKCPHHH